MANPHLTNDEFFSKLSTLFDSNRENGHGSIYLTQKRLIYGTDADGPSPEKSKDDPLWDTHPEHPLPIIVRASNSKSDKSEKYGINRDNRKKMKISTIVQPEDLDGFFAKYAEACKAGMTALKKRDRSKRKKDKKKKKAGDGDKKA